MVKKEHSKQFNIWIPGDKRKGFLQILDNMNIGILYATDHDKLGFNLYACYKVTLTATDMSVIKLALGSLTEVVPGTLMV